MTKEARYDIVEKIDALKTGCSNLVLATMTAENVPLASQAPFVIDEDGNFLVLVSGLAEHGKTLRTTGEANIMLVVDEAGLANPFARERLNYQCNVQVIDRGGDGWDESASLMKQRFGKFVETLLQLPDFRFFRLIPIEGRYVAGFGAAYSIRDGRIEQVRG